MRVHSISIGMIVGFCLSLGSLVPALASCEPGATPTYNDISGIAVRRCGTVGFIYESLVTDNGFLVFHGLENTPVKGYYEGHDGRALFEQLLKKLRDGEFFSIRLKPSPTLYIDGPCEAIQIMRCGVVTAIGGLGAGGLPFEADLKDSQTLRFDALVSKLQTSIFAWPWHREQADVTPSPSATPH